MSKRPVLIAIVLAACALPAAAQENIHVLRKGETLYGLAKRYGVPYEEILLENGIEDARKLREGLKIRIPAPEKSLPPPEPAATHRVVRGDTLYGIAKAYGVSIAQLRAANGLSEKSVLKEGSSLSIPRSPASAPPKPKEPASPTAAGSAPKTGTASLPDEGGARKVESRKVDPSVSWPVAAREVAYMTGKLDGVVLLASAGEPVRALVAGSVVSAGPYRGFGRVCIVKAANGLLYAYGGCDVLEVKEGDRVEAGAVVGKVGIDVLSGKPSLFFFVYDGDRALDPASAPRA